MHRATDLTTNTEVALKSFHVHRAFDPDLLPSLANGREIAAKVGPDVLVGVCVTRSAPIELGEDGDALGDLAGEEGREALLQHGAEEGEDGLALGEHRLAGARAGRAVKGGALGHVRAEHGADREGEEGLGLAAGEGAPGGGEGEAVGLDVEVAEGEGGLAEGGAVAGVDAGAAGGDCRRAPS